MCETNARSDFALNFLKTSKAFLCYIYIECHACFLLVTTKKTNSGEDDSSRAYFLQAPRQIRLRRFLPQEASSPPGHPLGTGSGAQAIPRVREAP